MEEPNKILVIEDDQDERRNLREALASQGYRVIEAEGMKIGLDLFRAQEPDLVVLDVHLPDGDGLEVCRKIRAHPRRAATPVVMLTGKGALEEKESGFMAGADQYLVKPVPPKELILWAQALLRRLEYDRSEGGELKAGDLVIDTQAQLVRFAGSTVSWLTVKEFELLYFLVKHRPRIQSRKGILSQLWHTIRVDRVVDVHIHNLRKKLPPALADRIQSVPGKGFRYLD